jgi:hypothetical protein
MAISRVRLYDIGTVFKVRIKDEDGNVVDLSASSTKQIIFRKSNGERLEKDAQFVTSGTDGWLKYESDEGDLDVKGIWKIQGYVIIGGGEWHSTWGEFEVTKNI